MPIKKATKDERAAKGLCTLCDTPRTTLPSGKPSRFCAAHLTYFREYQRGWRAENGPSKHNRCAICRQPGHTILDCEDPRAVALRETMRAALNRAS